MGGMGQKPVREKGRRLREGLPAQWGASRLYTFGAAASVALVPSPATDIAKRQGLAYHSAVAVDDDHVIERHYSSDWLAPFGQHDRLALSADVDQMLARFGSELRHR